MQLIQASHCIKSHVKNKKLKETEQFSLISSNIYITSNKKFILYLHAFVGIFQEHCKYIAVVSTPSLTPLRKELLVYIIYRIVANI